MHNSNSVDVYLHVTSKPIIERCTVVRFAPYTLSGDTEPDDVVRTLDIIKGRYLLHSLL